MEFVPGGIRLDDVSGGTLGAGVVPLSRFMRAEGAAKNAGAVTVTPAGVTIVSLTLPAPVVGDRVIVCAQVKMTKGAVAGRCEVSIDANCGAGLSVFEEANAPHTRGEIAIGAIFEHPLTGVGMVLEVAADFVVDVNALSIGSDATVAIGGASVYAFILRDS